MSFRSSIIKIFIFFIILFSLSVQITSAANLGNWTQLTPLPNPLSGHVSFGIQGKIYVNGGSFTSGGSYAETLVTNILQGGSISDWGFSSLLPQRLIWHSSTNNENYAYILGGFLDHINGTVANVNSVYVTPINTNGALGTWNVLTPLPQTLSLGAATVFNNRLYFAGGNTQPNFNISPTITNQNVYVADINPTDGTIGNWTIAGQLPEGRIGFNMAEINGYLYIFGGKTPTGVTGLVNRALINSNGTIGSWLNDSPSLPTPVWRFGLTRSGNYIIAAGGSTTAGNSVPATDKVYLSEINNDGTISAWQEQTHLVNPVCCGQLVSWNDYVYQIGGVKNTDPYYTNEVWMAKIETPTPPPPTELTVIKHVINDDGRTKTASDFTINVTGTNPSPTSFAGSENGTVVTLYAGSYSVSEVADSDYSVSYSPDCSSTISDGENKTCTITNDDIAPPPPPTPTPIPVTKVFFAPGFGGSWNIDALLNCKTSDYNGSWTLSPFAKDVYKPLLDNLNSANWETKPFYYDWRQDVRVNATNLKEYINTNTSQDEKVNLVGHSMGGLVGRAYLEAESGGKAKKFLSVGGPNQGSVLAYPIYSGGEVWANDLVEKIAANLYIKHCGIPASTQNILPTFDYLRNTSTHQIKSVASMSAKNNWQPTNFAAPFWDVKVGAIIGTGFPTLKVIDVVAASRNDIKSGKWIDGKPVGKENTNEGDGTVLSQSAQIPNAINTFINQNHSGIVASTEGISKILEFLGSPGIADPPYKGPESALVIVGYPGNFWIKDNKGNVRQSEDGVVTYFDPISGSYDLQIVPQTNDTLIIVEQILPNDKTLYKEYHLKGTAPKTEEIKFDLKHPSEDILRDKTDYKKPHFPNWGRFWWNLWERIRRG